jgi:polyisoprenoid-binding protein YceI
MIRTAILSLSLALALALAAPALAKPTSRDPARLPPGDYELDSRHASLTMKVAHMGGFSKFTMRFDKITGAFAYDPAQLATTKLTVTIDPTSIHTGLPAFDRELAGPSYLDTVRHPAITFVTTAVDPGADGHGTVTGDLSFNGTTRPVTLDATFNGFGPGLLGAGTRLGFSGTGSINRSDFGFTKASNYAADLVELQFEVEFTKH